MRERDYYTIKTRDLSDLPLPSRPSPLRAAVLFSSAAMALAVLVVPELDSRRIDQIAGFLPGPGPGPGVDRMAVGSIDPTGNGVGDLLGLRPGRTVEPGSLPPARNANGSVEQRRYVVRRSVLTDGSVCVIGSDGTRRGAC